MVKDGAFSHKIEYVTIFWEILNLEGHSNCMTGAKVRVCVRVCVCILRSRLVSKILDKGSVNKLAISMD